MSARPGLYGGQPAMAVPTVIDNWLFRIDTLHFEAGSGHTRFLGDLDGKIVGHHG
jgi:hypothetical protein